MRDAWLHDAVARIRQRRTHGPAHGITVQSMAWRNANASNAQLLPLQLKSMSKCGSTQLSHVLKLLSAASVIRYRELIEPKGLTHAAASGSFVISSVRNPCDYAVSLWAHQHGKPWREAQNAQSVAEQLGPIFESSPRAGQRHAYSSAATFNNWVRRTLRAGAHGIMSYRFYETLVAQASSGSGWL